MDGTPFQHSFVTILQEESQKAEGMKNDIKEEG